MDANSRSQALLSYEIFDLLSNTTILGIFYGVAFALYYLCTQTLYPRLQDPDKRRQSKFTLGYTSFVFFCMTVYLVLSSRIIKVAYINNGNFPGAPIYYEVSQGADSKILIATASIFDIAVAILTMAIQIWRLWVVWNGTRYAIVVTILPILLLLSYIVLDTLVDVVTSLLPPDQLGISDVIGIRMGTALYAAMSTITLFVTGMITIRLLLVRRRHSKMMTSDTSGPYVSIIAMLIESYALESAWSIASAISYSLRSWSSPLFIESDSTIKAIAYFLVVYRVASGRAWTRDTGRKLTSLQWNHAAHTPTNETSDIDSHISEANAASHSELAV